MCFMDLGPPWFGLKKTEYRCVKIKLTTPSQQCPLQLSSYRSGDKELAGARQIIPPCFDLTKINLQFNLVSTILSVNILRFDRQ